MKYKFIVGNVNLTVVVFLSLLVAFPVFANAKVKVVTTTSDLASLAKEIGKDKIEVLSLSKGTRDPHFIEVRPSMVVKLRRADLLVLVQELLLKPINRPK
ncbi:MAG: zinc ABC transporter substrate-binding protein [Candidatus Omnitrophica bacterium]|nr:zinc ABC transporter substrate-binding protein [Candidatus Omnitrophota bacterium]